MINVAVYNFNYLRLFEKAIAGRVLIYLYLNSGQEGIQASIVRMWLPFNSPVGQT